MFFSSLASLGCDPAKIKKIAVVRRNGLGDLLCACPLLSFLKEKLPQAKITLFVDHRNAPLVKYLPLVDEVALFPKRGNKYFVHLATAWKYRNRKFDLAISAKTSPMKLMNLFLFCLGAKIRVAAVDDTWHAKLINWKCRPLKNESHQGIKALHLLDPSIEEIAPRWFPRCSIPKGNSLSQGKRRLLISASTTQEGNRISPKKYGELVKRFVSLFPMEVLLIAQEQDKARAAAIISHLSVPHLLYFPRNFDEFMLLLDSCNLFFVGDGGVAHIGAALSKRVVVLFGGVAPTQWAPLSHHTTSLFHPKDVNEIAEEEIISALTHHARDIH